MPKVRPAPVPPPKNPVTLLDYLSFGVGALGGLVASHHVLHADGGTYIVTGGFTAMGVARAATISLAGLFSRRRLTRRSDALGRALSEAEATSNMPVADLEEQLQDAWRDWTNREAKLLTDEQFESELDDITRILRKRRSSSRRRTP